MRPVTSTISMVILLSWFATQDCDHSRRTPGRQENRPFQMNRSNDPISGQRPAAPGCCCRRTATAAVFPSRRERQVRSGDREVLPTFWVILPVKNTPGSSVRDSNPMTRIELRLSWRCHHPQFPPIVWVTAMDTDPSQAGRHFCFNPGEGRHVDRFDEVQAQRRRRREH